MKKFKILILSLVMIFSVFSSNSFADNKEMRAAWISTVFNMDWPSTKNNVAKQKQEYIEMLDKLQDIGMNTVVFQVRPMADALYKSSINPWSSVLTGIQGKDPGYDPLTFAIEEAHKRGMEFHAWFNPYRVTSSTIDINTLADNHPAKLNPDWLLQYKNSSYDALMYNPGLPEVRKHIVDTVAEVVKNYDIDGVHFDDYFYRNGMNDDDTYKKYGNGLSKGDWRRENVNTLLREVKSSIKSIKPNVELGVSPSGIWRNKSSDPTGSDTIGSEHYSKEYADSRTWIKEGLVDYIVPQIYWTIGYSAADYSKLVSWWSNEVKGSNVDLYIGQGVYRQGGNDALDIASEIKDQINLNRQYKEIKGSMYFSTRDILKNTKLQSDIKELNKYERPNDNTNDTKWIKKSDGKWYLQKSNGVFANNEWANVNGSWYRFDSNGRMLENTWYKENTTWYYLKPGGYMASNEWRNINGSWYRFESSGKMMENQWYKENTTWYYLKSGGYMASNETLKINGTIYKFDKSGKML